MLQIKLVCCSAGGLTKCKNKYSSLANRSGCSFIQDSIYTFKGDAARSSEGSEISFHSDNSEFQNG